MSASTDPTNEPAGRKPKRDQSKPPSKLPGGTEPVERAPPETAAGEAAVRAAKEDPTAKTFHIRPRPSESEQQRRPRSGFLTGPADGDPLEIARDYLESGKSPGGHVAADFENPLVSNRHVSKHNGVTHIYLRQRFGGLEVYNGDLNVNVARDGRIISLNNGFVPALAAEITRTDPVIPADEAVRRAAAHLKLEPPAELTPAAAPEGQDRKVVFENVPVSLDPVPVRLMYLPGEGKETRLVWNTVLRLKDGQRWLDMNVDAESGEVLSQANWIANADYRVFALPLENPDGGNRTLLNNPYDPAPSPFGWHDIDGAAGAEFNDTRGNNVYAQEDKDADDSGGFRPDGGAGRIFDYPIDLGQPPTSYESASITNLYYWNNILHDIHYLYGFDEAAGNFQKHNYGNGGAGNDQVFADSLDGSGTNNANFATPPDGSNPRMQMFQWTGAEGGLTVNSPADIAGDFLAIAATFGPVLTQDLTGQVVAAFDASSSPTQLCLPVVNQGQVSGKIALIDRGGCNFVTKVKNAQNAGAVAVLVANTGHSVGVMGGNDPTITIPSFMISYNDGQTIRNRLGANVNVTLRAQIDRDSSLDNVIVIHEYGHGVSNRLTGGAANSSALAASQSRGLGEGWGDWWGLALTAKPSDIATTHRAVGNYLLGQPPSGPGIRPAPYTTDINVNSLTYGDLRSGSLTVPHGIGTVWCTALWEVYWNLVGAHGFDPDFYRGSGGNNLALQLIMDGLKLQPANPSFLDARDAILMADQINNAGANAAILWEAFAKRGMGFSAYDGGSASSLDVVESFDIPDNFSVDPGARDLFRTSGPPGGPFDPANRTYTIENTGGGSLDWNASTTASWLDISPASGTLGAGQSLPVVVSVNAAANSKPLGVHTETVTFRNLSAGTNQGRNAILSVNDLADAVDAPSLRFLTDSPSWFSQTAVTHDGVDAAQSGNVDHGESSTMEAQIDGPDTLVFWWKVSSEENYDFLDLIVDGVVEKSISGAVDWTRVTHEIPAGTHRVQWAYQKDVSVDGGADAGWVDQVELSTGGGGAPIITSLSSVGGLVGKPFAYQIEATESPTSYSSDPLPAGLALNPSSGLISGTPAAVGTVTIDITATNGSGSDTQPLTIRIRDVVGSLPFVEDFEGGATLGDVWLVTGTNRARTEATQSHGPQEGSWHLTMDSEANENSRNELTVALDLAGESDVLLTFWAKEFGDESHGPPPTPFIGGADFDGVAISEDGVRWYEVRALRGGLNGNYQLYAVDLDAAIARHGLSYNDAFRIRFNHFDNEPIPADGIAIDDIQVQSIVLQTSLEVTAGGETTMPTFSGVANPGAVITLSSNRDGVIGTTTADGSGAWSIMALAELRGGLHQITASVYGIPRANLLVTIEDDLPPVEITNELVPFESNWKYLDDGSDQYSTGTPFYSEAYDDSGWAEGVGRFGYGNDGETTTVSFGGNASDKHITTYFRKTFTYTPSDTIFERVVLSLYADDGLNVYLNGSLLQSVRMPGGAPTHQTLASANTSGDYERLIQVFEISPLVIRPGENTIAVAVHQVSANTEDCGFDLRLALTRDWFFDGINLENTFREVDNFATMDFDQDGDLDLLYSHDSHPNDEIRIREHAGNNLFNAPVTVDANFFQGEKPIVADLNNDGHLDFIIHAEDIGIYQNDGNGGFSRVQFYNNHYTKGACLGDIDGDGYLDVLYQHRTAGAGTSFPIYWRPNDQTGEFGALNVIASPDELNTLNGMQAADMDGDGDIDVVASIHREDRFAWWENDGSGNFIAEHSIFSITDPVGFTGGDVDNDGDFDIVVGSQDKTYWYENDGTGGFGRRWAIDWEDALDHMHLRDLDGDGDLDLLCRFFDINEHIEWRENDGNGNFSRAQQFWDENTDVLFIGDLDAADWNGDGFLDVLFRRHGDGHMRLILSKFGAGPRINTFTTTDNTVAPGETVTLSWATEGALEVRLDGQVVSATGSMNVQVGDDDTEFMLTATNVDGTTEMPLVVFVPTQGFETQRIVVDGTTTNFIRSVTAGDLDGNGTQDIGFAAYGSHDVGWVSNDGSENFSAPNLLDSNLQNASNTIAADFDKDGDIDIAAMAWNDDLVWFKNIGGGNFDPAIVIAPGVEGDVMKAIDATGDGFLDLLVADNVFPNGLRAFIGSGSGFVESSDLELGTPRDFVLHDFTGDGLLDYANFGDASVFYLYPATGVLQWPWEDKIEVAISLKPLKSIEMNDFNHDGNMDIILVQDPAMTLFLGQGLGQFQRVNNAIDYLNDAVKSVGGDFDRDGDQDIAVMTQTGGTSTVYWLEGDGNAGFSQVQVISDTVPAGDSIIATDVDSDGALDLVCGSYDGSIWWFKNKMADRAAVPSLTSETDTGSAPGDNVTAVTSPDFTGQAAPDSTVVLRSSLDGILGTAIADGAGFWSITGNKLSHGTHQITVTVNGGLASKALLVNIDTETEPPGDLDLVANSDLGDADDDDLTSDSTPIIYGAAETGSTITLFSSIDGQIGTATANAEFWITTDELTDGVHQITAVATDLAGNVSQTSAPLQITIDTEGPDPLSAPDLTAASDTGVSDEDDITKTTTPTFEGVATTADEPVILYADGEPIGIWTGSGTNWSITPATPLSDGVYTIAAVQSDAAGNDSPTSNSITVTIDNTAPGQPTRPDLMAASDTGNTNNDNITSEERPTLRASSESGATVTLYADGVEIASGPGGPGWELTPTESLGSNPPADNTQLAITARAVDAAGNESSPSQPLNITIDNRAPTVTVNQAPGQSDPVSEAPIQFSVSFDEPVSGFFIGDVSLGGTAGPSGAIRTGGPANYTVTVNGVAGEGTVTAAAIAAGATDTAGNLSEASTSTDNSVTVEVSGTSGGGATPIDLGGGSGSFSGSLGTSDTDVFSFTLTGAKHVQFSTTGDVDTVGRILDAAGNPIFGPIDGGGTLNNFLIDQALPPGNYFIEVGGAEAGSTGAYQLAVAVLADAESKADNRVGRTLTGAAGDGIYDSDFGQTLNLLSRKARPVRAVVGIENDGDVFDRFNVTGGRSGRFFKVTYRGDAGNITAQVIGGIYSTGDLEPGDPVHVVNIEVKPNRKKLAKKVRRGNRVINKYRRKRINLVLEAVSEFFGNSADHSLIKVKTK